jgi:hypothetical protein
VHTEPHLHAPSGPADVQPERRADDVRALLSKASGHRLVLLHILSLCSVARTVPELDAETAAYLKGQLSVQAPSTLRQWLRDAGGLEVTKIGDGEASRDEWRITPAGQIALAAMSLSAELTRLLDGSPEHRQTYLEILRFCGAPRTREEIEAHLEGDPSIKPPKSYPSAFIAPLEEVGAIKWADKWTTTEVGQQACV